MIVWSCCCGKLAFTAPPSIVKMLWLWHTVGVQRCAASDLSSLSRWLVMAPTRRRATSD